GAPPAMVAPWVDRAVQLGAPEARYVRAGLRMLQADRTGALEDLVAYAGSPQPQHLAEALALRAQLVPASRSDVAALQARLKLAEDRPEAALALQDAARRDIPAAQWALARLDLSAGRPEDALPRIEKFLARSTPDDPAVADARAARDRILRSSTAAARSRLRNRAGAGLAALE